MAHNTMSQSAALSPLVSLRGGRALTRLEAATQVALAQIGSVAVQQTLRVEAVACVGRRAMFETALLTQAEQSLAQLVPLAASRLQAIADLTTLGIAQVVGDTVREVGR